MGGQLREIVKFSGELRVNEEDLAMKHNYLSTFLDENGKMLQVAPLMRRH